MSTAPPSNDAQASAATQQSVEFIKRIRERIATVIVGQDVVVERALISLFTGGHLLLQGVPGLAKTLLVSVLSQTVDLDFARIQFTIDLLPSDILGSEILDPRTNDFKIPQRPGLHQFAFGRRNQPRRPEGSRSSAGGDAGTQSHDRQ